MSPLHNIINIGRVCAKDLSQCFNSNHLFANSNIQQNTFICQFLFWLHSIYLLKLNFQSLDKGILSLYFIGRQVIGWNMKSNYASSHQFLHYCLSIQNIITKRRKLRIDEKGNLIHRSKNLLDMNLIFFYYCYMDKGCQVQRLFGQRPRPISTSFLLFLLVFSSSLQSNLVYSSFKFYHFILWTQAKYPNLFLLIPRISHDEVDNTQTNLQALNAMILKPLTTFI